MNSKEKILLFTEKLLSNYPSALNLKTLTQENPEVSLSELEIILTFISLFNVIDRSGESVSIVSAHAYNFLISLKRFVEKDFSIVSDWETSNYDAAEHSKLQYGIQFLSSMEKKRVQYYGDVQALNEVEIAVLLIKANLKDGVPGFLAQFNFKNFSYQLIGGYKKDENDKEEVKRLLNKELSLNKFEEKDYSFTHTLKDEEIFKISIKNGVYQKYRANFYSVVFNKDIKLDRNDRWLTFNEILEGKTADGVQVTALFDNSNINKTEKIKEIFDNLQVSLEKIQENSHKSITVVGKAEDDVKTLINSEESSILELKSSVRWDYVTNQMNKDLEKVIVKTIDAFLNTEGGTLIIGVSDNKEILGLEKDMSTLKRRDSDGFMQLVVALINTYLGVEIASLIGIDMIKYQDKFLSVIKVKRAPKPIFVKDRDKRDFFVRSGNTSKLLNPEEVYNYIQMNWS